MTAAVILLLAGAAGLYFGLWLCCLGCLVLCKTLKDEWDQEFFSDYFYGLRSFLTLGIWK